MPDWIREVFACVGTAGVFTFIQFLITRHDRKKGEFSEIRKDLTAIRKKVDKQERDNCRTQMLVLMSDYPEEKQELMTLAEHYFSDLKGDWYATNIFQNYLKRNNMPIPPWFNANHTAVN